MRIGGLHAVGDVEGDFNVPTPIAIDGRLLVTSENNGTRLYGFDQHGRIIAEPLAQNDDLAPDTSTPVVFDGLVLGNFAGLTCLDMADGLATLWQSQEDPLCDYCSFIAGNSRVLVFTQSGKLFRMRGKGIPHLRGFGGGDQLIRVHVWTPSDLSKEEKDLYKRLGTLQHGQAPKADKSFIEKLRKTFGG